MSNQRETARPEGVLPIEHERRTDSLTYYPPILLIWKINFGKGRLANIGVWPPLLQYRRGVKAINCRKKEVLHLFGKLNETEINIFL